MAMIEIKNISKWYGNFQVLKDCSVDVEKGEVVVVCGPSGSGKSTVIKLITGEIAATQGRLMVNGYNLSNIAPRQIPYMRRTLGIIFQDFRLIEKKTVYENLAFAMRAIGASPRELRRRIPYVLQLVGLEQKADRYPGQISGGEQQRIAIARAMLKNAPILLLDEATAFADPDNEAKVQAAFAQLAKGKTVLMIAHRLSTVANADCIYVVQDGQIVESGTKDELCAQNGLFARMWQDYQASVQWKVAKEG